MPLYESTSESNRIRVQVNTDRRTVSTIAKELQQASKHANVTETQIEQERANRHSILMQCKMDNIAIPMSRGNLDEVDEDGAGGEDPSIEVSGSQPSHLIYEREANIVIDYDDLEADLKEIDGPDELKKVSCFSRTVKFF